MKKFFIFAALLSLSPWTALAGIRPSAAALEIMRIAPSVPTLFLLAPAPTGAQPTTQNVNLPGAFGQQYLDPDCAPTASRSGKSPTCHRKFSH